MFTVPKLKNSFFATVLFGGVLYLVNKLNQLEEVKDQLEFAKRASIEFEAEIGALLKLKKKDSDLLKDLYSQNINQGNGFKRTRSDYYPVYYEMLFYAKLAEKRLEKNKDFKLKELTPLFIRNRLKGLDSFKQEAEKYNSIDQHIQVILNKS